MTISKTKPPATISEAATIPDMPKWTVPSLVIDLAACLILGDQAGVKQHLDHHVHVELFDAYRDHGAAMRANADQLLAEAKAAPDNKVSPADAERILARATAASEFADRFDAAFVPDTYKRVPLEAVFGADRSELLRTWQELTDGVARRNWPTARIAEQELARMEAAEILGQPHPLPDHVTVADIVQAAAPVTKTKKRIVEIQGKIDDGRMTGNDVANMRRELHQLQSDLGGGS